MSEKQNQESTDHRAENEFEDEIELMDFLLVIWKWKYWILGGTLAFAVIAFVWSVSVPEPPIKSRVEMIIKPSVIAINKKGYSATIRVYLY